MTDSMANTRLPDEGLALETLEAELDSRSLDPVRSHFAMAFRPPAPIREAGIRAYNRFLSDNGLFALRAPYMQQIESEVIAMCVGLFNPPPDGTGNFTSGGSESNYSALHAIREWAREVRPHIETPEIVAPYSAHPTFSKGCHYFGLKLVRTRLGSDLRADVDAMKDAINENTVGIVGSAPCWPYALIDPIPDISDLAIKHDLWMHVDACVGGYLAPFAEMLGHELPAWDFRSAGVRSISADLHKFGYCPKSASTILWRSIDLQRYHYVHPEDWPGGPYRTTGFAGTRSAGPIFAAWTVLRHLGRDGYLSLAQRVFDTRQRLSDGINAIEGLEAWPCDLLPLPFAAQDFDLQLLMGGMSARGWILLGASKPPLINLPIDAAMDDTVIETLLNDLSEVTANVRASGEGRSVKLEY